MVRLRRPPEWGVEPVPPNLRVLRTFDLFVMGLAAATLTGNPLGSWTTVVFVPVFGVVVAALALGGPIAVVRGWLERFAIWLVYASTAAIAVALFLKGPDPTVRYTPA